MIRIIKCLLALTVATAATLAQADWTYDSTKKTLTDGNWGCSAKSGTGIAVCAMELLREAA